MTQVKSYRQPYFSLQVEAQWVQVAISGLMLALFAVYIVQQGIKVARGEEIEKPF
ncbi:hypothetical protein ACFLXC_04675 [Chloroflexota bacterium]